MKTLLIVTCVGLFFGTSCACAVSGKGTDELFVSVRLTTGERSKDSNSETTNITVERDTIVYARTFGGSSSRRRPAPPRKVFKLSHADRGKLRQLIAANNLLVTGALELPQPSANYNYFEMAVDLTVDEKKGSIRISGQRTAAQVKEEQLYRSTQTLLAELYRIMNSQDKSVRLEELIVEPVRR